MIRALKAFYYFYLFIWHKNIVRSEKYNDVIYKAVSDLGGVYIKLLQFLSLRTEFFTVDQKVRFLSFYDQVPFEDFDIYSLLRQQIGEEKFKNFKNIEATPFASGSFGQVYKATLVGDLPVVIKVKKSNLKAKLRSDFVVLEILVQVFNLIYYQKVFNIIDLFKEFKDITFKEIDYLKEVKNAQYFYDIYKDHAQMVIPKTYSEYSTNNLIVQEYVGGIALTDLLAMKAKGINCRKWLLENYKTDTYSVLPEVSYEIGMQNFLYDRFYADPHPGNIKILENNRYAVIDFGIATPSFRNKKAYYGMMGVIAKKWREIDPEEMGEKLLSFAAEDFLVSIKTIDNYFPQEQSLYKTVLSGYVEFVKKIREKYVEVENDGRDDYMQATIDLLNAGKNFGVRVPKDWLSGMRTSSMFKSWVIFLEPEFHFSRYNYERTVKNIDEKRLVDRGSESQMPIEAAIEKVTDWLTTIAEEDYSLYLRSSHFLQKATANV